MSSMIQCAIVPVTPFQQNCSILRCEETGRGAIVDPGGESERLIDALTQMDVKLEKILLTHGHMDHCSAADILRQHYQVPIEGPHVADRFWLEQLRESCELVGFPPADPFEPDRWLEDGDTVQFGAQTLDVLHTPGHTPGHVVFFHSQARLAWVGDVLFAGSIGRTDFPQGDHNTLITSIRSKLWPLGNDVQFVPGHGPTSHFGVERQSNPFVADHQYG